MKRTIIRRVRIKRTRIPNKRSRQNGLKILNNDSLNKFNPSILDLGNINSPSQEMGAIAAVFDLSGFTSFCNQVDAQLTIPKFLNDFLDWFFSRIRIGLTKENHGNRKELWADLPVLVKFLGDGALLLWNTRGMTEILTCKIITTVYDICYKYRHEFYPKISMSMDKPPSVLRCGLARGKVFSIGSGKDYVGHCINTASRLANLSPLSFCFHQRGIQVQEYMPEEYYRIFIKKGLAIRGLGENEMVWIVKEEFDRLPEKSKGLFRNPDDFLPQIQNHNHDFRIESYKIKTSQLGPSQLGVVQKVRVTDS